MKVKMVCKGCGKVVWLFPSDPKKHCTFACALAHGAYRGSPTHGMNRTKLHYIWCNMKGRCKRHPDYAGRGIRVCEAWAVFEAFRDWALASGYVEGMELDRRDTNGNYEPSNCRWATHVQQMRNTRKRKNAKSSKYKGVSLSGCISKPWRAMIVCPNRKAHIGVYATEIEAAKAYDAAASKEFGEFVHLNFPKKEGAAY